MLAACLSCVFMVWLGLGTKGDELDYQILSKVTSGCTLTYCMSTRHLKQWSLAWRRQRSVTFVAANVAGNVKNIPFCHQ